LFEKKHGNVAEVARAVGYSDPNYFSKIFKKKFNRLPKAFQLSQLRLSSDRDIDVPVKFHPEFTIEKLDRLFIVRGSLRLKELMFHFSDKKGTPQRKKIFERVKELYEEFFKLSSALNEALKSVPISKLRQKIQEAITENEEEMYRSTGCAIERLDFHEIPEHHVRQNALSAAAVCMKADLIPDSTGYFMLRVKNYGQTFNLHEKEPFYNQPVAASSMCTGVLVDEDIVLTAAHFANEKNVIDLRFVFDFVMQGPKTPVTRIHEKDIYKGVEILQRFHNPESDWTLVKLDRNVAGREAVKLSKEKVFLEQPVYVIGHPCGLPLKFASGAYVGDVDTSDSYFMADLDIYSSNDGSPIYSAETHELIGIVSRGRARDFRWTGKGWLSLSYPHDHDDLNFYGTRCTRASEFGKYVVK
jgi:hypothetical protein